MMHSSLILLFSCCLIQSSTVDGLVLHPNLVNSAVAPPSNTQLLMAGFGSPDKKPKKEPKLKPKAQWDRYSKMKKEPLFRVAVRKTGDDEWLEVGRVRSDSSVSTELAVARQRAIISDHARRLFPLQVSTKDKIEWAFWQGDDDDGSWAIVDKKVMEGAPDGIEKKIGFEGRPDPATGFYCVYDGGRLQESKKLK